MKIRVITEQKNEIITLTKKQEKMLGQKCWVLIMYQGASLLLDETKTAHFTKNDEVPASTGTWEFVE